MRSSYNRTKADRKTMKNYLTNHGIARFWASKVKLTNLLITTFWGYSNLSLQTTYRYVLQVVKFKLINPLKTALLEHYDLGWQTIHQQQKLACKPPHNDKNEEIQRFKLHAIDDTI